MPASVRIEHLIALAIPLTYAVLVAIERCGTGWRWPPQRGWELLGVFGFVLLGAVNGLMSAALAVALPRLQLFDAPALGFVASTALGFLLLTFGNACLHRAYHRSDLLWRHVHQLHHAPARLGVAGVMIQTPFEMAANAVLFVLVTRCVLGLDPTATMTCAWLAAFYGMFQHCNLRTPRWLGWVIQRPESHCEHHRRGVHADNYSDLPLWDWCWGSLRNPAAFDGELGFEPAAARRVVDMLRGRDVNRRPTS